MENGLVNLIHCLPHDRYRHAVVCIEDASEFRQRIRRPDVEVFPLHRSKIGVWEVQRKIHGLCTRLRPAVVHSRNQSGLDALLPARLAGVRTRIHGEHGWDVGDIDGTGAVQLASLLDRVESTGPSTQVLDEHNPKAGRLIALYRRRRSASPLAQAEQGRIPTQRLMHRVARDGETGPGDVVLAQVRQRRLEFLAPFVVTA